ncbi:MAG: sugar ABC transporter ATP-binding protein [Epsilonproteobacteria bacterium]|nr:sugar ABC transporter ATP-binding protein [Campylobacterota bacterium]
MQKKPLIRAVGISKRFGATQALSDVSFEFYDSEIFSMVGANGAGKSTFIKILCGFYPDYEGQIYINDKLVKFESPRDAYEAGIQVVHQSIEQGIVQNMSVAENLALEQIVSPEASFVYDEKKIEESAIKIAKKMGIEYLDMKANIQDIKQSEKQMITIARALAKKPKLLILDEPTSSISEKEAEVLFETLYKLKDEGVSILYISHYLHEIKKISDRVGVIRDGKFGGLLYQPLVVSKIVQAMVGDIETSISSNSEDSKDKKLIIELKDLLVEGSQTPINLKIYSSQIIGLIGLIGAGKTELAETLFGIRKPLGGEIILNGKSIVLQNIHEAIKNGIHMVPENRTVNAIIPQESIKDNIILPFLDFFSKRGVLKPDQEIEGADRMIENMGIKCENYLSSIGSLSGGNQQKVVVARWLLMSHNIVILDEPFQGVDIKSRKDINVYLRENTRDSCVLMISSDVDELMDVCDKIVVLNKGKILGEEKTSLINKDKLLSLITQE